MFTLLVLALVVFAYYGGASCPKVLKDNRQMLLGVVVGLALFSFMGVGIEGLDLNAIDKEWCDYCINGDFDEMPDRCMPNNLTEIQRAIERCEKINAGPSRQRGAAYGMDVDDSVPGDKP